MDAPEAAKIASSLLNEFHDGNLKSAGGVLYIPRDTFATVEKESVGDEPAEKVILFKLNGFLDLEIPFERIEPEEVPTIDTTLENRPLRTEALRREVLDKKRPLSQTYRIRGVMIAWVHARSEKTGDGTTTRTFRLMLVDPTGSWEIERIVDPETVARLKPLRVNHHMQRFRDGPPASYTVLVEVKAWLEERGEVNACRVSESILDFSEERTRRASPSAEVCALVRRFPQLLAVVGVRGSVVTLVPFSARERDLLLGIIGGPEGKDNRLRNLKDAFIEATKRTRGQWNYSPGALYRNDKVYATPRGPSWSFADAVELCHAPFKDEFGVHDGYAVVIPVLATYGAFRKHVGPTDGRHDPTPGDYPHGMVRVGEHLTEGMLKTAILSPPFQGKDYLERGTMSTIEDFTIALRVLGTPVLQKQVLEFCEESGLETIKVVKMIPREPFLDDSYDGNSMVIEDESSLLTFLKLCQAARAGRGTYRHGTMAVHFSTEEMKDILGGTYKGRIESAVLHTFVRKIGDDGYVFQIPEEVIPFILERQEPMTPAGDVEGAG